MTELRTTAAAGADLNQAETAQDEPAIGSGPKIKMSQRTRFKMYVPVELDRQFLQIHAARFNLERARRAHKRFAAHGTRSLFEIGCLEPANQVQPVRSRPFRTPDCAHRVQPPPIAGRKWISLVGLTGANNPRDEMSPSIETASPAAI